MRTRNKLVSPHMQRELRICRTITLDLSTETAANEVEADELYELADYLLQARAGQAVYLLADEQCKTPWRITA